MSITLATTAARTTTHAFNARSLLMALAVIALAAGFLATSPAQTAHIIKMDGESLTRLMRTMAVIKLTFAALAFTAIIWRLAAPITAGWLSGYTIATTGMAAGPGLIWGMVHIITGAILLHGGLLAAIILLWRDPAVGTRLAAIIQTRRASIAR
jgi:hypothetical protein